MSRADHILDRWADHPTRGAPFVARHHEAARPARQGPTPAWLSARVRGGLEARGMLPLYAHQAEALAHVGEGRHVVVATPTASGKTLVYNAATLSALDEAPDSRALYLFPTKALAHDQVAAVDALAAACGIDVGAHAYDGDTPSDARRAIRSAARVVVSNPDMLHAGILPNHDRWHGFFAGLRYVVLDEVHTYRGVFGSHVANVLRRLKRVAAFHGASPQFVLCSATIANPGEHAAALIEAPVSAVTDSGAPRGARTFYVYNPPLVDGARGIRQSYVQAARRLTRALTREGIPTIVFTNSRLNVERLTRHLRDDVAADGGDPESVSGYRGGYLPQHRRGVEAGLRAGQIQTVVSTSALELGVDIGQLEACVPAGYPGTLASMLQRAGRAGRREAPASVVLVARSEPVDQYLSAHPDYLFERTPEHARVRADNLLVVADHVKCAAFELPFQVGEGFGGFGAEATAEVLAWLANQRLVHRGARRWQWAADPYPAQKVGLRGIAEGNFTVLDQQHQHTVVAEVDYHSAASTLYPQAIYIVGGRTYQVLHLDWEGRRALVDPVQVDYYTDAMTYGGVRVLECFEALRRPAAEVGHGEVRVFERVVGFKKIRFATGENVGYGEVDLPGHELHTTAWWIAPAPDLGLRCDLPRHRVIDALEGIAEAARRVAAVRLMCDGGDLGTALVGAEGEAAPDEDLPTVYLYERYPGGVGYHEHLFETTDALLDAVDGALAGCPCADGCPSCVGAPAPIAHEADQPRSRAAARRVLAALRGR